ncbi:MAG: zinc-ribbon domain-containing protein [Bacilli bacterium]
MEFQDKVITCKDCGNEFTFEAGQQRHFHSLGFTNEPVRCPKCRDARKDSRRNSQRRDNFGGRNNFNNEDRRAA